MLRSTRGQGENKTRRTGGVPHRSRELGDVEPHVGAVWARARRGIFITITIGSTVMIRTLLEMGCDGAFVRVTTDAEQLIMHMPLKGIAMGVSSDITCYGFQWLEKSCRTSSTGG